MHPDINICLQASQFVFTKAASVLILFHVGKTALNELSFQYHCDQQIRKCTTTINNNNKIIMVPV